MIQNSHLSTKRLFGKNMQFFPLKASLANAEHLKLPLVSHTGHLDPNMKYLIHISGTRTFRTAMLSNWMPEASGWVIKSSNYINQQSKYFSPGTYPKLVSISTGSLGNIIPAQFKNFSSGVTSQTNFLQKFDKPDSSKCPTKGIFGSVSATERKALKSPLK